MALLQVVFGKKLFSKNLVACIRWVGILFAVAAVVMPRLQGYVSSGFELFSAASFVLIDGWLITIGLLFITMGALIKIALEMQKEMDEIL